MFIWHKIYLFDYQPLIALSPTLRSTCGSSVPYVSCWSPFHTAASHFVIVCVPAVLKPQLPLNNIRFSICWNSEILNLNFFKQTFIMSKCTFQQNTRMPKQKFKAIHFHAEHELCRAGWCCMQHLQFILCSRHRTSSRPITRLVTQEAAASSDRIIKTWNH